METFVYKTHAMRIRFQRGCRSRVAEEADLLGLEKVMVLSTPEQENQAAEISDALGYRSAGVLAVARMHTPTDVTERAVDSLSRAGADGTVSIGGGSTIGLGKAIALRTNIPQIAIPTTYAGSEMTSILGQTKDGVKSTLRDARVIPACVLYDVECTLMLPSAASSNSGLNAIAHAVEGLYSQDRNPISKLQCIDAVRTLVDALPVVARKPDDIEARQKAQYGAFLCGLALGQSGMALHHKLCHVLGGAFDLPHAETHAVVLPYAAEFNADAEGLEPIRQLFGDAGIGAGFWEFARLLGAPSSLAEIGMPEDGIERAADLAVASPYWNPRSFDRSDMLILIRAAFDGARPAN
ncbi:MAG: maleylacetate reductase [Albidovulum sp.]|nr:maleylacetate reductase [Albidovulum sp.]